MSGMQGTIDNELWNPYFWSRTSCCGESGTALDMAPKYDAVFPQSVTIYGQVLCPAQWAACVAGGAPCGAEVYQLAANVTETAAMVGVDASRATLSGAGLDPLV